MAAAHARGNPVRKPGTPPSAGTGSGGSGGLVTQQRLQGAFLTVIGVAGMFGGVLFSIEAPRFTPVPVVFLTFWLVMVIVGKILFTGLGKLRDAGVGAPAPQQLRAAAAVAGIVVAVGMMGFAATSTGGVGVAAAAPCPGGGPATCGPTPGPELTFTPPQAQTTAPGQQGQQGSGQDNNGIATSPSSGGGENGPGIQAQTPQFGTPGQQAPNIPGNEPEQPAQGGQQPAQGNQGGQQGQQNPVRTTAPGRPDQNQQQTQGQQSSEPTVTVTKTESQCAVPGAGGNGAAPGGGSGGGSASDSGSSGGPDSASGEDEEGAPSWAYLVGEVSALMTGRRGRKAGPLNKDGSAPTNTMVPDDQIDGDNYKQWTTADGDRTYILSQNKDAPSQYRFALGQPDGGSSKVNDDGSVSVFDRAGKQVNRFDTPWAYDSVTGQKIATRYSVDGNDLVQTIDRPEGNNNPILADPNPDGTPTIEELTAALRAPTAAGPDTPQQAADRAVAGRIAEQKRITDAITQPVTSAQQPDMTPPLATPPEKAVQNPRWTKPVDVPDTPGQPAVDPSGSGTKLPSAVDAAPGEWSKHLGEDADQYRKFFPSTVYPLSSTKTNHNGIENIAYQMSDGSILNITENYSGDAPLRRQSIEKSPILGDVDINPSQGTATSTRTGAQILVETLDNVDQALSLVPGPLKGARVITKGAKEGARRGLDVPERTTVDATKAIPRTQPKAEASPRIGGNSGGSTPTPLPTPSSPAVPSSPTAAASSGVPSRASNGYPTPRSIKTPARPKVSSDAIDVGGLRVTNWADGGWVKLNPLNGRASTGIQARITKDMIGQGTRAAPGILPPGWKPSSAWPSGDLQRGHGLARILGGTGRDSRNIFTITKPANDAMQVIERQVVESIRLGKGPVDYSVTPVYGNGTLAPPTSIVVRATGPGIKSIFRRIPNIP
jgi:hypothetical protein